MNFKKVFAAIIAGATFFAFSPAMDVPYVSSVACAQDVWACNGDNGVQYYVMSETVESNRDGGFNARVKYVANGKAANAKTYMFYTQGGVWYYSRITGVTIEDLGPISESHFGYSVWNVARQYW